MGKAARAWRSPPTPTNAKVKGRVEQLQHNSTVYVLFLLLSSYMFWPCHHLQGAYTIISLKCTAINSLQ